MLISSKIRKLRVISFLLFFTPALALIVSLFAHNYLVSFNFKPNPKFNFIENIPGEIILIPCDKSNDFCKNVVYEITEKLHECNKYSLIYDHVLEDGSSRYPDHFFKNITDIPNNFKENENSYFQVKISDNINQDCILNSNLKKYYDFIPFVFEKIFSLKYYSSKISLGTSVPVNPILYGETSISNIVKRYPIKNIFKPLIYLSIIFMVGYWFYYNAIFNQILNKNKVNLFFIFGILSSVFLLLHVIFLGWIFENEILTKLRRSYIVFFILFEILAQGFLIKEILKNKTQLAHYINKLIVYLKFIFVFFICFSTILILVILIFYDLDSKVDYILEWNYFLILLFFYLLSFFMWKRNA